jgi:hypothetical protein
MSDNSIKIFQPTNPNVAFCGRDEAEVLADRFEGDPKAFFQVQNRRKAELLSNFPQVEERPKTLVELKQKRK